MMYALVYYPDIDIGRIDQLRRKYDPQVGLIEPHITLMFPVPETIGEENLVQHLESILSNWQSFHIHLQGLQISSDDHLFLLIQEGNSNLVRLHDKIYTGPLAGHRRKDISFIPHLTLGVLSRDANEQQRVLEESRQLAIDHDCLVDKLHLVRVSDDRSKIVWSREFTLRRDDK